MRRILILSIFILTFIGLVVGREDPLKKRSEEFFFKSGAAGVTQTVIDANNITSWISVISSPGGLGWPPLIRNSYNGTFPRGSGVGMIYSEGLMIGGLVNDGVSPVLRAQGIFYRTSIRPGRIVTKGQAEDYNLPEVKRVWRVRPDYQTADLKADAAEYFMKPLKDVTPADEDALRQQYENDWKDWPADKGAPWYTTTGPDAYKVKYGPGFDPNNPNHVPGIPGATQTVWTVGNDLDASLGQSVFSSVPIGLEIQVTEWCYAVSNPLNNIIFQQFRIIYKGTATADPNSTIDSVYVVKWSDPDLGEYSDDLAGCDSVLGLGYVYNANTVDAEYQAIGYPAPAVGFDFLQGPAYYTGNPNDSAVIGLEWRKGYKYWNENPLTTFVFFAAGTGISDPTNANQWFNLMRGGLPRPEYPSFVPFWSAFTAQDPNAYPTKYAVAGDPVTGTGWIDGRVIPPGDRRIVNVTGPFRLSLGDTAEIVVALIGAMGADNLSSVLVLKYYDTYAQFAYDNLFVLPSPPPAPNVKVAELDRQIVLNWGWDQASVNAIENFNSAGFIFEGYNVYQLPSATAGLNEAVKIATYDVINDVTVILDRTIDPKTGVLLSIPVQTGSNSGIKHFLALTTDYIRQRPLVNGQTYYYAVTAYAYNPDPLSPFRALESTPIVLKATPQSPPPGSRYFGVVGDTLEVIHKGKSDGEVVAILVDPSITTGHTYQVRFDNEGNWYIVDVNENKVKATGTNQSGDEAYPVVDGIFVKVMGPPLAGKEWVAEPSANRWFTGNPANGGEQLFGAVFLGPNFTGSSLAPGDFKSVEIRFSAKTGYTDVNNNGQYDLGEPYTVDPAKSQKAFMYQTWNNGAYEGFFDVPFQVFDIENPNSPRQLNVVVRDRNANRQWDISDANDAITPYEYIWILDSDYDPTGKAWDPTQGRGFMTNGSNHSAYPVLWALWLYQRGTQEPYRADVTLKLYPNRVNTPADTFVFVTQAPTVGDVQLARQDVEKINAFPNPYYGFNLMETDRLLKYITFNHLPKKATIRIFNLAGVLVKTIYKDDDSQFARWNLRNEHNLPVASGIYIVHIDMPDIGKTKILKLMIVQEEEIIPTY
ncbi:T9SS type A sorting domain-containing protein [Candidatus Kryptobacter tengchongensis]|uniref:Por secretion system C-terminal sorting domain-containing protein n=1 Tax=Kryptobacter tengchongensis TaxID=1643429 RepID=A0A656D5J2_KRYT1|nr:T9SS type A sorting domain-containing protein [Candidatus Kryptobacter tengchongensis]CUS98650.1 Por secretion system C-terminal sorting domain-containing protein [Candidatus Kryptobacter tengchongensis]